MQKVIKHSCPLFEADHKAGIITHLNCGVCSKYVLNPPSNKDKNCLKHDELVVWSRENCK